MPQLVSGMFLALLRLALHITHDKTNGFPVPVRRFDYNYDAILNVAFVFHTKTQMRLSHLSGKCYFIYPPPSHGVFSLLFNCLIVSQQHSLPKKKKTVPNVSLINASHS